MKNSKGEVTYSKWVDVLVSEQTAEWYEGSDVDKLDWKNIVDESNSKSK